MKPSVLSIAIAQLLGTATIVSANDITVNSAADSSNNDGNCTLREAIDAANQDMAVDGCGAGNGADRIVFSLSPPATIVLNQRQDITAGVTITGPQQTSLTIDANNQSGFRHAPDSGQDGPLIVENLTIRGASGSALFNSGTATLRNVTISGATSGGDGGGIVNRGVLTIESSTIVDNTAAYGGGGIFSDGGRLDIRDSTIQNNEARFGGGLFNAGGTLTIENSVISANSVDLDGGGILSLDDAQITGSRLTGNEGSKGGGIFQAVGDIVLEGSTLDNNSASQTGGGLHCDAVSALFRDSTLSNNSASSGGAAYGNQCSLSLIASTAYQNNAGSGGGIFNRDGEESVIRSVIVRNSGSDCSSRLSFSEDNYLDTSCGNKAATDKGQEVILTGLMNRGATAPTHVPTANSPLVDSIANTACDATDQSGLPRPVDLDNSGGATNCDVGAAERQAAEFRIGPGISGLWFDPRRSGEGFLIDVLGNARANVFFFTFDNNGGPMWLIGDGTSVANRLSVNNVLIADGARFGNQFNANDVNLQAWGSLSFEFLDCDQALVRYDSGDFGNDQIELIRLSSIAGVPCDNVITKELENGNSGAFFAPDRAGEGIQVQMVDNAGTLIPVVYWFTYDNQGNQLWLVGVGRNEDDAIIIDDVLTLSGAQFGTDFDPDDVQQTRWGSLRLDFSGCDNVTLSWDASDMSFGSGSLELIRLYGLAGTSCSD